MKPNFSKGFTLIEVLTVILVTGVLLSLLALAVTNVFHSAQRSKSVSNLRQIQMMHQLWIQDEGYLVEVFRGGSGSIIRAWGWQIWRKGYAPTQSVFFAPSRPPRSNSGFDGWYTYGMNLSRSGPVNEAKPEGDNYANFTENIEPGIMSIQYNRIQDPANYLLFAETSLISNPDLGFMRFENARASWNSGGIRLDRDGKALGVFLDGSAERIDTDRLRQLGFTRVLDSVNKPVSL